MPRLFADRVKFHSLQAHDNVRDVILLQQIIPPTWQQ